MSISAAGIPQITPDEAAQRIAEGALLLDVREDDEWTAGHAPDAQHLPLGRIEAEYMHLDRSRPVVAICRMGGRSERAAFTLRGVGFDVVNLIGGMQAWAAGGHPVVSDDGGPGQVI